MSCSIAMANLRWLCRLHLVLSILAVRQATRYDSADVQKTTEVANASDGEGVDPSLIVDRPIQLVEGGRQSTEVSYKDVLIPRAAEMHSYWLTMKQHECADEYYPNEIDYPIRFCALAYGRNSGEMSQWSMLGGACELALLLYASLCCLVV
eukprot:TRINITY_DN13271_c0_g2_i2.p1 TRINITY_DN13271_c0_g2~~TRINITY_DN13271_c0_g2_i2.p1  ORF type:complete len:151 (+),score=10.90 TRINITY_DN13271_c0_g2_i2:82-534(+)